MRIKNVRIKKIGDENFSYSIPDDLVINEEVNSVALMSVLDARLTRTTLGAVMARLERLEIGREITVQIESPL